MNTKAAAVGCACKAAKLPSGGGCSGMVGQIEAIRGGRHSLRIVGTPPQAAAAVGIDVLLIGGSPLASRAWSSLAGGPGAELRRRRLPDFAAALEFMAGAPVGLVLADLSTGETAWGGAARLRALHGQVPLIALTDESGPGGRRRVRELGAQEQLGRGELGGGALRRVVRHALERRRLEERIAAGERRERLRDAIIARIADNAPLSDVLADLGQALSREVACDDCGFAIALDEPGQDMFVWPADSASGRLARDALAGFRQRKRPDERCDECRACLQSIRSGGRLLGELALVPGAAAADETLRAYAALGAELAGLAVERLQTSNSLRQSREELRRLSAQLMMAQETERQRIAGDLHDVIGQSLSVVKVSIEEAERRLVDSGATDAAAVLGRLVPWVKVALGEVRRISMDLRPATIDDLGIVPTLSWFFREFSASCSSIAVQPTIAVSEGDVPQALKIVVFRILQEAFSNIVKHAGARRIEVRLERIARRLSLSVADDGCGFDPADRGGGPDRRLGIGLSSMRERARLSGGHYALESSPGAGTRIVASWPLDS